MDNYKIKLRSYKKAKQLGLIIRPSLKKNKKIDVFDKNNNFITSIGATGYKDYPSYLLTDPKLAEQKKINYKKRHEKYRNKIGTPSYYADQILWS